MNRDKLLEFHEQSTKRMFALCRDKNNDYANATNANSDAFKNFNLVGAFGFKFNAPMFGFFTRMMDKFSRFATFIDGQDLKVSDESIEDTLLDLGNYAILAAAHIHDAKLKALYTHPVSMEFTATVEEVLFGATKLTMAKGTKRGNHYVLDGVFGCIVRDTMEGIVKEALKRGYRIKIKDDAVRADMSRTPFSDPSLYGGDNRPAVPAEPVDLSKPAFVPEGHTAGGGQVHGT